MALPPVEAVVARLLGDLRLLILLGTLLLALLVSITLRWPSNRIVLALETGAVAFEIAERTDLADLDYRVPGTGPVRLYGVPELDVAPHVDVAGLRAPLTATVTAEAVLQSLRLGAGSGLELRLQPKAGLDAILRGAGSADIELVSAGGELRVVAADGKALAPAILPEPIEIALTARQATDRMRLRLPAPTREQPIVLAEEIKIRGLTFGRERSGRDDRLPFRSAILGGTIRMQDTARTATLQAGDPIWLENFDGIITSLRIDENGIKLHVLGTAARIAVGPPDFEEELTPTVLAYLYNKEGLKALWGSFLFILAALWQLRSWARARSP
ncbi:MAG: hypothetical protein JNK67_24780 [Alphaproteobacteria bacterium]|nr:hypothetical protein [Alphaproteobacteria bacterium]